MCQTYDVCFIFNLGNKNLGIYCHLSLILCYFWRQNCLKTSILLLWATLVNMALCWPYVCDITKWSLRACKYLSQVPPNSSRGSEGPFFWPTKGWWNNHLQFSTFFVEWCDWCWCASGTSCWCLRSTRDNWRMDKTWPLLLPELQPSKVLWTSALIIMTTHLYMWALIVITSKLMNQTTLTLASDIASRVLEIAALL